MSIVRENYSSSANASVTTHQVAKPTGTATGDVLYLNVALGSGMGTVTPDSQFTEIATIAVPGAGTSTLYRRVVDGSETSTFTWTTSVAVKSALICVRYSGVDTTTPEDATPVTSSGTAASWNATGITTVTDGAMVIATQSLNADTASTITESNLLTEVVEIAGKHTEWDEAILATAGATGTLAYSQTSALGWGSIVAALRPATGGGGGPGSGSLEIATLTAALPSSDSAGASDSLAGRETAVVDGGGGTDTASVAQGDVPVAASDSAVAADSARVELAKSDSAVATDAAALTYAPAVTDAGTATDVSAGIALGVRTESGSGTDAATTAASLASTESAVGTDNGTTGTPVAVVDSAVATEGVAGREIALSDAGTATDTRTGLGLATADAGAGADAASSIGIARSDSSVGTETATAPVAVLGATETGAGTDGSAVSAAVAASEAGAAADVAQVNQGGLVNGTDAATGTDAAVMSAAMGAVESAVAAEASNVGLLRTEAGTGTDTALVSLTKAATEAATAADAVASRVITVSDSAAASDGSVIAALFARSDTGAGAELAVLAAGYVVTDSVTATETAGVSSVNAVAAFDGATGGDTALLLALLVAQDAGQAIDSGFMTGGVKLATATGGVAAVAGVSGIPHGIAVVEGDVRRRT